MLLVVLIVAIAAIVSILLLIGLAIPPASRARYRGDDAGFHSSGSDGGDDHLAWGVMHVFDGGGSHDAGQGGDFGGGCDSGGCDGGGCDGGGGCD